MTRAHGPKIKPTAIEPQRPLALLSYYAASDHGLLIDRLVGWVERMRYPSVFLSTGRVGLYWCDNNGIALGSSLHPIIIAFYLIDWTNAWSSDGRTVTPDCTVKAQSSGLFYG